MRPLVEAERHVLAKIPPARLPPLLVVGTVAGHDVVDGLLSLRARRRERLPVLGRQRIATPDPGRPDERQRGQNRPLLAEVDLVETLLLVIEEQRGVADDQGGVAPLQHNVQIGTEPHELRFDLPGLGAQNPEKHGGSPGIAVDRDRPERRHRPGGEQRDRGHLSLRRHREIGHHAVLGVLQVLDGGNQREIRRALVKVGGASSWQIELQIEEAGLALEAFDERPRVQVLHGADAN